MPADFTSCTSQMTFVVILHKVSSTARMRLRARDILSWFSKMASKRKFAGENSGALVPVKKPKQNQIALTGQGGAIQAVCVNICCDYSLLQCCEVVYTWCESSHAWFTLIASTKNIQSRSSYNAAQWTWGLFGQICWLTTAHFCFIGVSHAWLCTSVQA